MNKQSLPTVNHLCWIFYQGYACVKKSSGGVPLDSDKVCEIAIILSLTYFYCLLEIANQRQIDHLIKKNNPSIGCEAQHAD